MEYIVNGALTGAVEYRETHRICKECSHNFSVIWGQKRGSPDPGTALLQESWEDIELPHTWNATDTVDAVPGYRRDASWYRKVLPPAAGQRQVLYFEGANMETDVYVNGQLAGRHVGGYVGFDIEITDFLEADNDNLVMVRVSNAYNPNLIPSQKSDFFIHGGITRDVWLKKLSTRMAIAC